MALNPFCDKTLPIVDQKYHDELMISSVSQCMLE